MEYERLKRLAARYYSRKDIKAALVKSAHSREVVPLYFDRFGKRPDQIQYEQDIAGLVEKGATSFHCSEELWRDPLMLSVSLKEQELNELRIGWDLVIDVDCNWLDYSKLAAELLCEAFEFHGISNFGLKFSGNTGWHLGLPFSSFPSRVGSLALKDFFPQGPRFIASYLSEMIKPNLSQLILEQATLRELAELTQQPKESFMHESVFDPFKIVKIDTILIASRHLFRMPYSLHEKTALASIVIKPEQLKHFRPGWAKPERVLPKSFMPEPEPNEAKHLLLQALDFAKRKEKKERKFEGKLQKVYEIKEQYFPPCIKAALKGISHDGRKRALFVLINFFRSLGLSIEQIKEKVEKWNKLNYKPLSQSYLNAQLNWFSRQAPRLPPNCETESYYKDIGLCKPEPLCSKIKNPVNYVRLKAKLERQKQ